LFIILVQVVVTQVSSIKFAFGYIINLKPYLHLQRIRWTEVWGHLMFYEERVSAVCQTPNLDDHIY